MAPPDIARATNHSLTAVDRYIRDYEGVKVSLNKELTLREISHAIHCAIVLLRAILVNPLADPISTSRSFFSASWPSNHCDRPSSCSAGFPFNLSVMDPILSKECGL